MDIYFDKFPDECTCLQIANQEIMKRENDIKKQIMKHDDENNIINQLIKHDENNMKLMLEPPSKLIYDHKGNILNY